MLPTPGKSLAQAKLTTECSNSVSAIAAFHGVAEYEYFSMTHKAVQMESDCAKACAAVCDIQADESVTSPEAVLPLRMLSQEETPTYLPGLDQAQVLRYAALAAKWHEPARDALDTLVLVSLVA